MDPSSFATERTVGFQSLLVFPSYGCELEMSTMPMDSLMSCYYMATKPRDASNSRYRGEGSIDMRDLVGYRLCDRLVVLA